ncbi:MAG TPA: DUF6265 family protein [Gammaproteobacteria bacterium]
MTKQSAALAVVLVSSASAIAVRANSASIADLAWLSGCWASEDAELGSGEQWMAPAGGTMFGVGRTVKAGTTVTFEFLEIRETPPGKLVYVARPSGQAEAAFPLQRIEPRLVVFENSAHDFPQRVIYRLEGEGLLRARIEGTVNGEAQGVDFPMRRVACEAP